MVVTVASLNFYLFICHIVYAYRFVYVVIGAHLWIYYSSGLAIHVQFMLQGEGCWSYNMITVMHCMQQSPGID